MVVIFKNSASKNAFLLHFYH